MGRRGSAKVVTDLVSGFVVEMIDRRANGLKAPRSIPLRTTRARDKWPLHAAIRTGRNVHDLVLWPDLIGRLTRGDDTVTGALARASPDDKSQLALVYDAVLGGST